MSESTTTHTSRLRGIDLLRLGWHGVRAHPARATLSALGIAIGIAAMISVIGISLSSQAKVQEQLAALGTNMLTVSPGESFSGAKTSLPADSAERLRRIDGVEQVSWVAELEGAQAYEYRLGTGLECRNTRTKLYFRDCPPPKADVSEVYSPPRMTEEAKTQNLTAGSSFDFTMTRKDGKR